MPSALVTNAAVGAASIDQPVGIGVQQHRAEDLALTGGCPVISVTHHWFGPLGTNRRIDWVGGDLVRLGMAPLGPPSGTNQPGAAQPAALRRCGRPRSRGQGAARHGPAGRSRCHGSAGGLRRPARSARRGGSRGRAAGGTARRSNLRMRRPRPGKPPRPRCAWRPPPRPPRTALGHHLSDQLYCPPGGEQLGLQLNDMPLGRRQV
jgi:hypothetical protein